MADTKKKINYDVWLTALKTGTYSIIGIISTSVIQYIQGGYDLKSSLILGIGFGAVAGIRNVLKHGFGLDLDLTKLKA